MAYTCLHRGYAHLRLTTVPISTPGLSPLLFDIYASLNEATKSIYLPLAQEEQENKSLHISLTRPLILRNHERDSFYESVQASVSSLHIEPYVSELLLT